MAAFEEPAMLEVKIQQYYLNAERILAAYHVVSLPAELQVAARGFGQGPHLPDAAEADRESESQRRQRGK